jgi:pimeloyl-ACP methyl ester carboxylesterase
LAVITTLVVVYGGLCVALFVLQRSLLYQPRPASAVAGADTVTLQVDDAGVQVTVRVAEGTKALLYFGGNAEDVNGSLGHLAAAFPDRSIYLMHYRGYGGSTGKPSERALVADALSLFDKVHAEHDDVLAVGASLGSGVAIQLASRRPISRLVLVTPYDSILNIASRQFPYFPVRWLLIDKFESWRYAAAIAVPTLIIAAERDEVVPRASTEALVAHFKAGVATLKIVAGVGHNSIAGSAEYARLLAEAPQ